MIDGGAGNDLYLGSEFGEFSSDDPGADSYSGGPGNDRMDYSERSADGVNVSLDGKANDGMDGEGDNVASEVEQVWGTDGPDHLTGGNGPNTFDGRYGNDTLTGNGGDDNLQGSGGLDQIDGGADNDTITGGDDADTLTGGPGVDSVYGDYSNCSVYFSCAGGNDTIDTVDGQKDLVSCGPGADTATVDSIDTVVKDPINGCESVSTKSGHGNSLGASIHGLPKTLKAKGKPAIRLACRIVCRISAKMTVSSGTKKRFHLRGKTIAKGQAKVKRPGQVKLRLHFLKGVQHHLHGHRVKVKLRVVFRGGSGKPFTIVRNLKVKG